MNVARDEPRRIVGLLDNKILIVLPLMEEDTDCAVLMVAQIHVNIALAHRMVRTKIDTLILRKYRKK